MTLNWHISNRIDAGDEEVIAIYNELQDAFDAVLEDREIDPNFDVLYANYKHL